MINNEFDLNLFSLDNIDRIEICKGAQSTLYGSDAIAGVINIITFNRNAAKPVHVKASLSEGSFGTFKSNVQLYGKKDRLTYSVKHARVISNGFSSAYDSTGQRNFDNDGYNGHVTNAQVTFKASDALLLKSFLLYSQYKAGIDAGVFRDEKDYTINNNTLTTGAGFTYTKGLLTLNGLYQYSELQRKYYNDSLYRTSTIFEDNQYFGKTQFTELYASLKLNTAFTLLAGGEYRFSAYNSNYRSISIYGPYNAPYFDTSLHQKAIYASLNYSGLQGKINIEAGGRLNSHSRYGTNYTYTVNPSIRLSKHARAFASIASGFKAPTLYHLSLNSQLSPEKSVNYEAGVQYANNTFTARAVYFNRKINNGIDYNYITYQYFNFVKQVVNGIEIETSVHPVQQLTISGNYTFIGAQETTQNRKTNKDTVTYQYALRRPKHSINATIAWQPIAPLYLSVSGKFVSSRYDVGGYQAADVLLKEYFVLGGHAEYSLNAQVKLFVDLQNMTGRKFFDVRGYNSIPATINGGVVINL